MKRPPSRLLHRASDAVPPVVASARGLEIVDTEGRVYLDASGGAAVSCLGHGHPAVTAALKAQLDEVAYVHSSAFTTRAAEALAETLVANAPPGLTHAYLVSGGSEAMEAALKLARQYANEIGQSARRHFIARRQSYHGNTLGALAVGGNAMRRAPFEPLLFSAHHVSAMYAYRDQRADETGEAYGARLAAELEAKIAELGPGTVIGFVAETIGGATQGCTTPPPGYWRRVREVCDRHGVLLILDEVMCGMGRCGTMHACVAEGIAPDILVVAKGLGAGYVPVGALLMSGRIHDAIRAGTGYFQHGHTYAAHPLGAAAALAVQRVIAADGLVDQAAERGRRLERRLRERLHNQPVAGDIRGRGLFFAVELVEDRTTKAPFDPARKTSHRVFEAAMRRGLMCYPMSGTIDGRRGDHVLVAPAFIATEPEIDDIVDRLADAIAEATA